ncbi:hypothetical protein BDQ12DRAFT_666106 [Crucibulum laeve]|uniref:Transmembrane protein n=1 Tax=Crucibulum laeve TaxID=68775 RepID=A0A5C3LZJ2_9AGAR|nr:hypothetical protein BDQ12DRAFT_666106 [Crucibulum laeve]
MAGGDLAPSRGAIGTSTGTWNRAPGHRNGPLICRNRLPLKARIALGVTACAILFLVITLMLCVSRNRSSARAAAAATEYNVEAAQMQGPPALIATHYNPTSGPAGVYRTSAGVYATSAGVQASNPGTVPGVAYPARAQVYSHYGSQPQTDAYYSQLYGQPTQPRTAPASKVSFQQGEQAYSFGGYEPGMAPAPPRTAYVSSGFPRPLYTGTGKDKDEEELRVLQEVNGGR